METEIKNLLRHHRDTLFRVLFMIPENFVQLVAYCNKDVPILSVDDIMPFDLDSVTATRRRRNDVSFITKDNRLIILIEHQSTINANIALRLFMYYIELLQLWIKSNDVNIFGSAKIRDFPVPELYVVYNGKVPLVEKMSTFVIESRDVKINAKVNIIDIHFDKLGETKPDSALAGYAYFYSIFDKCKQGGATDDDAFMKAREECIKNGYLFGFINKEEFVVFYKDFLDYDTQLEKEAEARGEERGLERGMERGLERTLQLAIQNNAPISLLQAVAKDAGISQRRLEELMAQVAV